MENREGYEVQIVRLLRDLPPAALTEVLRLVAVMRDVCMTGADTRVEAESKPRPNHERTRKLLATSTANWAQDLIRERDDRL